MKPALVETWIRDVRDIDTVANFDAWSPFQSRMGRAPFDQPGDRRTAGRWSNQVKGTVISNKCDPKGRGPRRELVTTFKSTKQGAWSTRTLVDYTSGGEAYTLAIDWAYIACGTGVELELDPDC